MKIIIDTDELNKLAHIDLSFRFEEKDTIVINNSKTRSSIGLNCEIVKSETDYILCKHRINKSFLGDPFCTRDNKPCTLKECKNPEVREKEEDYY